MCGIDYDPISNKQLLPRISTEVYIIENIYFVGCNALLLNGSCIIAICSCAAHFLNNKTIKILIIKSFFNKVYFFELFIIYLIGKYSLYFYCLMLILSIYVHFKNLFKVMRRILTAMWLPFIILTKFVELRVNIILTIKYKYCFVCTIGFEINLIVLI